MFRLLIIGGLGAAAIVWALVSALQAYEGPGFWASPASLLDYLGGEKADLFVRWTMSEGYGALPALAFLGTLGVLWWQIGFKKGVAIVAAILLGCALAMGLSPVAKSIGLTLLGGFFSLLGMGFSSLWVTTGVLLLLGVIAWGLGWLPTYVQLKRWLGLGNSATGSTANNVKGWWETLAQKAEQRRAEKARRAAEAAAAAATRQAEIDAELAPLRAMAAEEIAAIEAKAKADRDAMLEAFKAESKARMEEFQRELEQLRADRATKRAKRKAVATQPEAASITSAPQSESTAPAKQPWKPSPIGNETFKGGIPIRVNVQWSGVQAAPPPVVAPPVVVKPPPVTPQVVPPSATKPEDTPATQPRGKGGKFVKTVDSLADLGKVLAEKGMVPLEPAPATPKVDLKQAMRNLPQADFKAFRNALSTLQRNGVDLSSAEAFHYVVNGDVEARPKNPKPLQKVFKGRAFSDEQREAFKATLQALKAAGATLPTDYETLTL